MNKTILTFAILAFCIAPSALSSETGENGKRELISINITNALNSLLNQYLNSTHSTNITNNTSPIPVTNNTSSSNNTTTAPVTNNTTTAPVTNNTSSTNITTTPPVANTTQPNNTTTTPTPTPVPTPTTTNWYAKNDVNWATFPADCLRIHNQERMKVGVVNLTWSDAIATTAQAWAENMAANGFRHSGRTGENIASSTYSTKTLSRLLGLWVNEQSHFIPGCTYPKCSNTTGEVGHYTQMVWAKTTELGCGLAPGVNKSYNYLCCQYTRSGNVVGQTVYPYPVPIA